MTREWIDLTPEQYARAVRTSYSGGSSWYYTPDYPLRCLVAHGQSPMDVYRAFESGAPTVRMELFREWRAPR